jgi:protein gp37
MNRANSDTGWVRNPDGSLGWTLNPITGCLNHVDGLCKGGLFPCFAYRLAHGRLRERYLAYDRIYEDAHGYNSQRNWDDPFCPRFWPERLEELKRRNMRNTNLDQHGIFIGDMTDLFGVGIPEPWTMMVMDAIGQNAIYPGDRIYLLTKQPQNLSRWSPFPENCWVGVTATTYDAFWKALSKLKPIEARVKFISVEPLLEQTHAPIYELKGVIDWLIIGACTGTKLEMAELVQRYPDLTIMPYDGRYTAQPKLEWVKEIIDRADAVGIPVFLKDNLRSILCDALAAHKIERRQFFNGKELRQEFPKLK